MKFSEKLQTLRKEKGLSQEKLGNEIGVSRQAITKWENGTALPEVEKIIALSEYFLVTTDYLLKDTVERAAVNASPVEAPPKKAKLSLRLKLGIWLAASASGIWAVLWLLSQCFPVHSVTVDGMPLVGFFGFLGYHQILHESYAVAAIGFVGVLLILAELLLRKIKNKAA